ncbi:MAG: class I SAM-dependent methyltransferase [Deltaproteobacteria bacterium]|nr:class I SAM-dependent methyltransferase [Deltaproteobacteria bacterium]
MEKSLHMLLNQPLSFIQKTLVDGLYTFYFDLLGKSPEIDEDAAGLARETFKNYFPETLEEMLEQLLSDPEAYQQKVIAFEKACPPVFVDFPTNPDYYRVITSDPSRRLQEVLTRLAFLSNCESFDSDYYALDMGTGYGRLARVIEDAAKAVYKDDKAFRVFGMDISDNNIKAAKELNHELGTEVDFFTRDMNQIPFPSDSLNLVNITDASYLNFRHRRPFYLAEIARVLSPEGGVCCITNPNENTTLKEYNYVMMRTNYKTYFNPFNIMKATVLGKCSIYIDALSKARPDWELTTTADMTHALTKGLKTDIVKINNWPEQGGPAIYSGFTFAVNDNTKKQIEKYTAFRERNKSEDEWFAT